MNQWSQQPAQMTAPILQQCWASPPMNIPPVITTPINPLFNAMNQFALQNGCELRAPAPHLQALVPPSMPTAHFSTQYSGMPYLWSPVIILQHHLGWHCNTEAYQNCRNFQVLHWYIVYPWLLNLVGFLTARFGADGPNSCRIWIQCFGCTSLLVAMTALNILIH